MSSTPSYNLTAKTLKALGFSRSEIRRFHEEHDALVGPSPGAFLLSSIKRQYREEAQAKNLKGKKPWSRKVNNKINGAGKLSASIERLRVLGDNSSMTKSS